jgi:hypothetical protein
VPHQPRSTQRHEVIVRDDEDAVTAEIVELASSYGRYGYRRITAMNYRPPAPSTIAGSPTKRAAVEGCSAALRSPPPRVHITNQRT